MSRGQSKKQVTSHWLLVTVSKTKENTMNTKHYLVISGIIGGVIGSLLTALLVSPVTAQRDKFGEIECTELRVVDADGGVVVKLGRERMFDRTKKTDLGVGGSVEVYTPDGDVAVELASSPILAISAGSLMPETVGVGGVVTVSGADEKGSAWLSVNEHGGSIGAFSNDFRSRMYLNLDEHDGGLEVSGKNGGGVRLRVDDDGGAVSAYGKSGTAVLGINERGGHVTAYGKDAMASLGINEHGGTVYAHGEDGQSAASLTVNEHGGRVGAFDKAGKLRASLSITEHGGRVQVKGKGEGAAGMGINEYGNGAISTWDKNGYRQ